MALGGKVGAVSVFIKTKAMELLVNLETSVTQPSLHKTLCNGHSVCIATGCGRLYEYTKLREKKK